MSERMPDLPEDAKTLVGFADLNPAWLTVDRTPDGTIYLTTWWHGTSRVLAVVRPDGTFQKADDYP